VKSTEISSVIGISRVFVKAKSCVSITGLEVGLFFLLFFLFLSCHYFVWNMNWKKEDGGGGGRRSPFSSSSPHNKDDGRHFHYSHHHPSDSRDHKLDSRRRRRQDGRALERDGSHHRRRPRHSSGGTSDHSDSNHLQISLGDDISRRCMIGEVFLSFHVLYTCVFADFYFVGPKTLSQIKSSTIWTKVRLQEFSSVGTECLAVEWQ
jgi:hypothetical protein